MAQGCSNRAIGANLSLSEKTVEAHVRGIFTKLGLLPAPDETVGSSPCWRLPAFRLRAASRMDV